MTELVVATPVLLDLTFVGLESLPTLGEERFIGRSYEVIIHAELVAKDLPTVEAFEARVAAMDEVVEFRRMFGIPDYFIRVQVADVAEYERWLTTKIMGNSAIARMDSRLTMKVIKLEP